MEPFDYRIFVCIRERPAGKDSCVGNGSLETVRLLKSEIAKRGLLAQVKVNTSSCLDLCSGGPHLIVYPEGIWYSGLTTEHVMPFIESQLLRGEAYAPCLRDEAELAGFFEGVKAKKTRVAGGANP